MKLKHLFILLLTSTLGCAQAATLTGRIVAVADGDTVTLLDDSNTQHKIRLAGIDAPEKKQDFGMRAKQSLSELVFDKQVQVETDKKDRYGRQVGKIWINGQDANLEQVSRGFAWHYKQYAREQSTNDRKLYDYAQKDASAARRGLWVSATPTPPWEFRHKGVSARTGNQATTTE
jgi:endonuclease YncB( thermonuclease family)